MQKSTSLKNEVYEAIRSAYPNTYSTERAEALARGLGYKISNYERRARELTRSGLIRMVKNEKGHIMGYIWVEGASFEIPTPQKAEQEALFKVTQNTFQV